MLGWREAEEVPRDGQPGGHGAEEWRRTQRHGEVGRMG